MGQVIDFQKYKNKKEEEDTLDVDFWQNVLDYERMAEDMQKLIDQLSEQLPEYDEKGVRLYTVKIDKDK